VRIHRVRVGEVLRLERRPITVDPLRAYREIGVRSFGRGIFHKEPITGSELGSKRVFHIEPGDLVLSNVFAWEGAVALAGESEHGLIGSHRFMTYVPRDERLLPAWAAWFFVSEPGLELLGAASPGSAGRNRTLAIERFRSLEIPLPPLDEQRQVVDFLGRVQAQASALLDLTGRADRLASAIPSSLAIRPDLDDQTRKVTGWRSVLLGDVMTLSKMRVPIDLDGTYRIAGIYSFGRGFIDRGAIPGRDTSYKEFTKLSIGDVVVSKLNGWEGAVAVVSPTFDGYCVSSEYPVFELDASVLLPGFFDGVARSPSFWAELDRKARGSMVRRRRINPSEFLSAEIWVPPLDVQVRVARKIASVVALSERRRESIARLEALVPAALNEVFSGLG
jgi:hypothetical protein